MARYFFEEEDLDYFLEDFGVRISWIDEDGALRGTKEEPIYARFLQNVLNDRDDLGARVQLTETLLMMKTTDAAKMLVDTEIIIAEPPTYDEKWLAIKNAAEVVGDGDLTVMPVQPIS